MHRSLFRSSLVLMACAALMGCPSPDNPKMPDIKPTVFKKDTTVPAGKGEGGPYGASKKYQDLMKH